MRKGQSIDIAIIGAGLSGLAAAHFIKKNRPDYNIQIFEKSNRIGGAIQTHIEEGFIAEAGPHGYLDNVDESIELIKDLNIEQHIRKASLTHFIRYLCLKGTLFPIPQHPLKIIKSDIMPFWSKVRVLGDFIKKPITSEQTIANWAQHRFGKAMLPFIDAVITGTFAGDINKLSIDAVYPGFRKLEKEYGSVIKGFFKSRKNKKRKGLPAMTNFDQGMSFFIKKLAENHNIQIDTSILSIEPDQKSWRITTDKQTIAATNVLVATNINQALLLLNPIDLSPVMKVPESRIANVVLGFEKASIDIPHGFGYLAPQKENRFALGAMFSSHMFPERAPEGHVMLEVMVGGRHHPDIVDLPDEQLIEKSLHDLKSLMRIRKNPVYTHVIKTKEAFPQLEIGHLEILEYKKRLEAKYAGLFISGFGWNGIGMNEMIKEAKAVADQFSPLKRVSSNQENVKVIYF
jgi:protoporphyrinogen/coproporphyrinogen III oxidase